MSEAEASRGEKQEKRAEFAIGVEGEDTRKTQGDVGVNEGSGGRRLKTGMNGKTKASLVLVYI